jgi:hypothetical protein
MIVGRRVKLRGGGYSGIGRKGIHTVLVRKIGIIYIWKVERNMGR